MAKFYLLFLSMLCAVLFSVAQEAPKNSNDEISVFEYFKFNKKKDGDETKAVKPKKVYISAIPAFPLTRL
jgi:hypothetical protein